MLTNPTRTITPPQPENSQRHPPPPKPIPPCPTLTRLALPQGGAKQC